MQALKGVNLEIKNGEYFTILGNTGGGKTTLLHIIAGLVTPSEGQVFFDDTDITQEKPYERNLGLVFEQYALFPHYNVEENIAYSHMVKGKGPRETRKLVSEILSMLHLEYDRAPAFPSELSGGMQQRVALGRALMNMEDEGILLLDEPFKALDAGLRMDLRVEIRKLAKELKLTTIHITNDMTEAMMVSDRIAIIHDGQILQVGSPHEIYFSPASLYVSYFMSEVVYFKGIINEVNQGVCSVQIHPNKVLRVGDPDQPKGKSIHNVGEEAVIIVRNDYFKLHPGDNPPPGKKNFLEGEIAALKFMGPFTHFRIQLDIGKFIDVEIPTKYDTKKKYEEHQRLWVSFSPKRAFVFPNPGDEELEKLFFEI